MAKTVFVDGDTLKKLPGARVLAAWLNKVFAHRHDGRDQDGSAPLDYAADTGAADALVVAMPVPFDVRTVGLPFQVKVGHDNTGPATLALDAFAAAEIHKLGGLPLAAGDIQEGQIIQLAWDGANYQLLSYNSPPVTDAVTLQGQGAAMLAPPGAIVDFGAPTVPAGWLPCDGRAVLRAQYPALFAYIGTTWGAGDNVTTFNLPELRGEFRRGWDNERGVDADRQFGSFQADELKSHDHTYTTKAGLSPQTGQDTPCWYGTAAATTGATGGVETRPRNIAVLVCIKY